MFEFWHDFLTNSEVFVGTVFILLIVGAFGFICYKMWDDL